MKKTISSILFLVTFARPLFANSIVSDHDLSVSIGNLCEYIGKFQTNENGKTNTCSFLPTLSSTLDLYLDPEWAISPQLTLSPPQSGRDENIKRMIFSTLLNVKYKTNYVSFFAGPGLFFTRISGPGGSANLRNGNSFDSFPLPDGGVFTRNLIINLGMGLNFNKEWTSEIYTYVFNAFEKEDRAFSAGASLTYHFGKVQ